MSACWTHLVIGSGAAKVTRDNSSVLAAIIDWCKLDVLDHRLRSGLCPWSGISHRRLLDIFHGRLLDILSQWLRSGICVWSSLRHRRSWAHAGHTESLAVELRESLVAATKIKNAKKIHNKTQYRTIEVY